MVFGFFRSLKYAANVRSLVAQQVGETEAARIFDLDWVTQSVDAFSKDNVSVDAAAKFIFVRLKYEPKTYDQSLIRDELLARLRSGDFDISNINPEIFFKLIGVAIRSKDAETTAEWFLQLIEDELSSSDDSDDGALNRFVARFQKEADQRLSNLPPG